MKLIKRINLLGDKKLITGLNIASVPLFFLFIVLFFLIARIGGRTIEEEFVGWKLLISTLGFSVVAVIHELIHGIFFKLFNPQGKVRFGFEKGMAYATSPNTFYPKGKFSVILLAPFVIISGTMIMLYHCHIIPYLPFLLISSVHGAGCVGDFYFIYLILRTPKNAYVEDTEVGISFYSKNEQRLDDQFFSK